jgi:two-component system sensor histidine kinase TctE
LIEGLSPSSGQREANASIRSRLYKALIVPLVILVLVDAFIGYEMAHRFATQAYDEALQLVAEDCIDQLQSVEAGELAANPHLLRLFKVEPKQLVYRGLYDANMQLIAGANIPAPSSGDLKTTINDQAQREWTIYNGLIDQRPVRIMQIALHSNNMVLRVAEDGGRSVELEHLIHSLVLVPQLILLGALLWIIQQAVSHGLSPMRRLGSLIVSLKGEARLRSSHRQIPAEAKPLVEAIDELLDRLSDARGLQDRFIADAAHQLKTPLAAIITYSELLQRSALDAQQGKTLQNLQAGADRLSRVLKQLLAYLRNAPESPRLASMQTVNLSNLVQEAALEWAPRAVANHQDFGLHVIAADLFLNADPMRLREMLDNLLDNALRYSPAGGQISVSLIKEKTIRIRVEDSATIILASERERIFERFYRIPGTRQDGSGLGLAIVKDIASLHGAILRVGPREGGQGNCFEVCFPIER